jgi:predicted permease
VSARMAEDELAALAAELRRAHPSHIWEGERLIAEPGGHDQVGSAAMLALVVALVVLILIVACGNLGSLLLARGASRRGEMALRVAIGAGAGRLVRQLFTESLVLAGLGCFAGILLGTLVLRVLMVWTDAPAWLDPSPDWRVVAFAAATSVLSALLFGLLPARHIVRRAPARRTTMRSVLIGAQVAASCVLLVVAGLLVRAFERAATADPGFEYEHVAVIEPSLLEHGYSAARAREYVRLLSERIAALPGVEATSVTSTPPLGPWRITAALQIEGQTTEVFIHQVDQRYLSTMKIPLLRGRDLTAADERGIVVSESFARRYWPGREAIGQPFGIGDDAMTVVGIAASARPLAPGDPDALDLYRLARDADAPGLTIVARTSVPTETLLPAIAAAAHSVEPNVRPRLQLLKDAYRDRTRDVQRGALAVSALGVIALAVACLGVAGLVAYSVAQRTKEIGIRMALGARSRHIVDALVRQYVWTIAAGLALGVIAAGALAQLLRRELYGVSTVDPLAYVAAIAVFLLASSLAAIWPARRALRVDPLVALRRE